MKLPALLAMLALCACTVTTTTNPLPDGTKVTVTSKSSDPVAIKAAIDAATLLQPTIDKLIIKQTAAKATP